MGLSSRKSTTNQSSTQQAVTTPQVPEWISGPYANYTSAVSNLLNQNPQGVATPASATQRTAFSGAQSLGGANPSVMEAQGAMRGLFGYTPQTVGVQRLADTDLTAYLNPYTQSVIDTSMADLDRARRMAITGGQAQATAAGAYGGSRHGVADAETNRGFLDTAASLAANLRSAGYNTAVQGAQFDIGNRFNADTANQGADLAGAGLRLSAANNAGQLGLEADNSRRADVALQLGAGQMERDIAAETDPVQARLRYMAQIGRLLALGNPELFTGQRIDSTGTASSTTKESPSTLDSIGRILQIADAFSGKP